MKSFYLFFFLTTLAIFPLSTRAGHGDLDRIENLNLIETLEKGNRLQEAQWISRELGDEKKAQQLQIGLFHIFSPENFLKEFRNRRRDSESGGGASFRFTFRSNNRGLFKPDRTRIAHPVSWFMGNTLIADAYKEVAAYVIDQIFELDLVPFTQFYEHSHMLGSLQAYMEDMVEGPTLFLDSKLDESGRKTSFVASESGEIKNWIALLILDYLTDNRDRHLGNLLLWKSQNRIIAIDHGLTFSDSEFYKRVDLKSCFFSAGLGFFRYAGFADFNLELNANAVAEITRRKLLTTPLSEIRKKLSPLLTESQLSLFLKRLVEIQRCLS